jgi:AraC-like DNA-binding protein
VLSPACCGLPVFRIESFGESVRSVHFDFARLENRMQLLPYPHRHDFYHVVWVTQGSGWHVIDSERYEVRPDTVFFMAPGQVHDFQLSADAQGYTINFSAEFFALQLQNKKVLDDIPVYKPGSPVAAVHLDGPQAAALRRVIAEIAEEYEAEEPGYHDVLRSCLSIFLARASRYAQPAAAGDASQRSLALARRFQSLLEQHFRSESDPAVYARMLRVTERVLNDATRRALGGTVNRLIRDRVVLEAKRLLLHSSIAVAQVADQLGFDDPAYFSRCFKKHTGRSPVDYRHALAKLHTDSPRPHPTAGDPARSNPHPF